MEWIGKFDGGKYKRFFVVFDENVYDIWGKKIVSQLEKHGKEIFIFKVKPEERSKSLEFYPEILEFFEDHACSRYDLVIGIGGGIILDLVSFFCSTYMRGLPLYAIPTTLIGQVDAITAGKTCLNTGKAKNVLGTFYYPLEVYNNIHILKTNQPYFERQGLSEIFKYGLLASRELLEVLDRYMKGKSEEDLKEVIKLTIQARGVIRKKDPLASNLGHTFGHALEKMSGHALLHGDAITVGTVMAFQFAVEKGLMTQEKASELTKKMKEYRLNVYLEKNLDLDAMIEYMLHDKKSSVDMINLVLLEDIERPYEKDGSLFYGVSPSEMKEFLERFIKNYEYMKDGCWEFIRTDDINY